MNDDFYYEMFCFCRGYIGFGGFVLFEVYNCIGGNVGYID